MHSTLVRVERKLKAIADQYGNPASFGAYLARVAQAIGAKSFVFAQKDSTGRGWSYDDSGWRITDVKDGIYSIDQTVAEWIKAGKPQAEEAQAASAE